MRAGRNQVVLPALLLGLFFLCVYLLSESSDLDHNGDTYLRYQTTQTIVDHGRLWVAHPRWLDTRMAQGRGGHLYAFYAPGQAVFMLPLYLAGKLVAHSLSLPQDITTLYACRSLDLILGAVLAAVFFLMAVNLGYSIRASVVLTLLFGLATAAWPDAQSGLEQTQVDLFLLVSVFFLWRFVRDGMTDRRLMLLSGVGIGLAIFTRYDAALYVPFLALFPALIRLARRWRGIFRDWLWFSLGLVPWLFLVALWDWARFGSPLITGLHEQTFGEPPLSGFLDLTVSPGKGIIWYVPLVLMLPWAVNRFARRLPLLSGLFLALVLLPLLFYANVLYWHGDPAWGPRYLYVALPYLVLPLGEILTAWPQTGISLRAAFLALTGASLLIQVAAVSVTEWRDWYHLEVVQQRTADASTWSGQPFHWGALRYHYYWNVEQSPILAQIHSAYQVIRLNTGEKRYRLLARPDPYVSNPADGYPVNTLAFWWADQRHPLLGDRTRAALAALLAVLGGLTLAALWRSVMDPGTKDDLRPSMRIAAAG